MAKIKNVKWHRRPPKNDRNVLAVIRDEKSDYAEYNIMYFKKESYKWCFGNWRKSSLGDLELANNYIISEWTELDD